MEQDYRRRAHRDEGDERVGRHLANARRPPEEQRKEQQHERTAEEPELLAQHAEDEVRMFFGQEREVRLRTVAEALPHRATGTDGRDGLQHLVAVAQRVAHRVEERIHALLLVRFEHVPRHGTRVTRKDVHHEDGRHQRLGQAPAEHGKHNEADEGAPQHLEQDGLRMREQHRKHRAHHEEQVRERKPREEEGHQRHRDKHERRTEVRLLEHQRKRHDEQQSRHNKCL